MFIKRPLRVVVVVATYSILSLVYATYMYKPGASTEPALNHSTHHSLRRKLEPRRMHRNENPVIPAVNDRITSVNHITVTDRVATTDGIPRTSTSADAQHTEHVYIKEHDGYVDVLTGVRLRLSCNTCAVVSSSGHLLNTSAGTEIDSAECVFRMNNAPVRGFEDDVGTRTTLRSIAHVNLVRSFERSDSARQELLQDVATRSRYLLINWMNRVNVRKLQDREYRYAVLLAHLNPGVNVFAFNSNQMHYAERIFRQETGISRQQANTWLSTGWFTMLAAMDICDHITVYGMVDDDYCATNSKETKTMPYHYYQPNGMKECAYYNQSETRLDGGHLFITEKAVFRRWALKRRITFKYPIWNIDQSLSEPLDSPFLRRYRQLLNDTNYTITSVRDYVQLEREAKRRAHTQAEQLQTSIVLKRGNDSFVIEKGQLMEKVMELVPEVKPIKRRKDWMDTGKDRNIPVGKAGETKETKHKRRNRTWRKNRGLRQDELRGAR